MTNGGDSDHEEDLGFIGGVESPPDVQTRPVNLAVEELVRAGLAMIFALMLAGTGAWAFILVGSKNWEHVKSLLDVLIPAETALLGSAVGFYFGTKK